MQVEKFEAEIHLPAVYEWLVLHGKSPNLVDDHPEIGVVVVNVGVIFLRMIEGGYALLDGLTTNPLASSEERREAIDLLIQSLLDLSKKLGIKRVLAHSTHLSLIKRCELSFGFELMLDTMIARRI